MESKYKQKYQGTTNMAKHHHHTKSMWKIQRIICRDSPWNDLEVDVHTWKTGWLKTGSKRNKEQNIKETLNSHFGAA